MPPSKLRRVARFSSCLVYCRCVPAAADLSEIRCLRHIITTRSRHAEKEESNVASETSTAVELKIPKQLLDQLITGPITQGEFETIYRALKKTIIERAMSTEMTEHLGYKHGELKSVGQGNQRNGTSGKTLLIEDGSFGIEVPRDREGSYASLIVGKHERRFTGFDQKIIALYALGVNDILIAVVDGLGTRDSSWCGNHESIPETQGVRAPSI